MKATAYIVGSGPHLDSGLKKSIEATGLAAVEPYDGLKSIEMRMDDMPVSFVLFEHSRDTEAVRKAVRQLRGCKRRHVRFMPLIYLCHNPSRDLIQDCLMLGFDDVITLPRKAEGIAARLRYQLERPITYYETPHYFGPDRRGNTRGPQSDDLSQGADYAHNRFEFVRELTTGVSIIAHRAIAA